MVSTVAGSQTMAEGIWKHCHTKQGQGQDDAGHGTLDSSCRKEGFRCLEVNGTPPFCQCTSTLNRAVPDAESLWQDVPYDAQGGGVRQRTSTGLPPTMEVAYSSFTHFSQPSLACRYKNNRSGRRDTLMRRVATRVMHAGLLSFLCFMLI